MTQRNCRGAYLCLEHDRAADWDWLAKWQPNVIRYMGQGSISDPNSFDVNRVRRIHETCPDATILLRCWDVDDNSFQAHNAMVGNPRAEAQRQVDWWAKVFDRANTAGVPRASLMAGLNNETGPEKDAALYPYTQTALEDGTRKGVRLGVFVFSVGRPSLAGEARYDIPTFSQLDKLILANKGAVLLHEYLQPEGMYAVWTDAQGNERKDYTYLIGRHTRWDIQSPIIIGEWGIDGILYNRHPDPKYGNSGWRNFKAEWPPSRYADEYVECIRQASDNVIAICPFISDFSDHKWQSFDLLDAYGEFLARKDLCVKQVGDTKPDTPPETIHLPVIEQPQPAKIPALAHPIQDPYKRVNSQRFGDNPADYARFGMAGHTGIDFAVPEGTVVCAADGGVVQEAGELEDYGTYIKLRHPWGESVYAHLSRIRVDEGMVVGKGEPIAMSGNTGNSTGPHLHFAIRIYPYKRGAPYDGFSDPAPYLEGGSTPALPAADIPATIKAAAAEFGLDWRLLASQAWAESSFNPKAVSSAGAKGLMQIVDATWAEWSPKINAGNDPFDARQNARVGAAYLVWLLKQTEGSEFDALVAYGWGIGNWLNDPNNAPEAWSDYASRIIHGRDMLKALGA